MTPSKITEGLLYSSFMKLFFDSKKKKVEKFWKSAGFRTNVVVGLRWSLPLRRFTDWVAAKDDFRLTFSFEAFLDLFTTASSKEKFNHRDKNGESSEWLLQR